MFNGNSKKILKGIHLVLVSSILGGLLSILCILLLKCGNIHIEEQKPVYDLIMLRILTWVVNTAFFGVVFISFIYGLFTEWGFFKYYWIIIKWVSLIFFFGLTWFGVGPAINGLASVSDAGFYNTSLKAQYIAFGQKALIYVVIEVVLLILIFLLSALKPWGRTSFKAYLKRRTVLLGVIAFVVVALGLMISNKVMLENVRNMPIKNVELTSLKDGTYYGEEKAGHYTYKVKVTVEGHMIVAIEDLDSRTSPYVEYARGVFRKILKEQKVDIDAVSGATTTSKAFMKAVENALLGEK